MTGRWLLRLSGLYDEVRMIALAPKTTTLYFAFVERGDRRRIVSLRRATRREVKHYVESI